MSYRVYKRKLQIFMFKLTPVTSKIGQGHPSSNLTKTLLRYIHGISFGSMRLIFDELSCLQAKCWQTDRQTDGQTDRRTDRRTDQSNSRVGYKQPAQKCIKKIPTYLPYIVFMRYLTKRWENIRISRPKLIPVLYCKTIHYWLRFIWWNWRINQFRQLVVIKWINMNTNHFLPIISPN